MIRISQNTWKSIRKKYKAGLQVLRKTPPKTGVEWADEYFYLPEGSSQISGRWVTQPLQVAPLNMMCSDAIRAVDWQKSARVGYTKCLVIASLYLSVHRSRNGLIYQPTDEDSKDFVVDEVDPVIEQMPIVQRAFPGWQMKDESNTVKKKKGLSFTLDFRGAFTPKNFRRMTKQFIGGDEVDAWPLEVGKEGDPIALAQKRLDGATFPKELFGTTPTTKSISHIEKRLASADAVFNFNLPCPHCNTLQSLQWGGKGALFGIRWDKEKTIDELGPKDVWYQCKNKNCASDYPSGKGRFYYSDLAVIEPGAPWIDEKKGIRTVDGLNFFTPEGVRVSAPRHVGVVVNAIYSLTLTDGWRGLVREWFAAKGDPLKLKAFINTVLGELWEDETGERLEWEILKARREPYRKQVPMGGLFITCFVDTQDDRFELVTTAWGRGEESWVIDYRVIYGDPRQPDIWADLRRYIKTTVFVHESGIEMSIRRFGQDAGGHFWDEVHDFVKTFPVHFAIACKGDHLYGQPVVRYIADKNKHGVRPCWIGTDTAKDVVYGRYSIIPEPDEHGKMPKKNVPIPGMMHFPIKPWADDNFFQQAVSEIKKIEIVKGKKVYKYGLKDSSVRNEVLDCISGNLAMIRLSTLYFNLNLNRLWESLQVQITGESVNKAPKKRKKKVTGGRQ